MIITLKGADFSTSNIGTLSSWNIKVLGSGVTYNGVSFIDKDAALNVTITIAEGYELNGDVTVTMGGNPVTSGITVNGNTITVAIGSVTGNVIVNVPTKSVVEVPDTPTTYTITYKYVDSTGATIKADTTETATAGTTKNFSTSDAAIINGYTVSTVSPTSATINSNTTVTYTYTVNSVSGGEDEMTAGTYTYTNSGYILATSGKVTTGNTWIHSDFIPVSQLANGDDGKCVRTFTGHGTVAAIAFYTTKDNFDSWVKSVKTGEIEGGATSVTAEYVKGLAPAGSNYVVFSTDGSKQTLSVTVGNGSGGSSSEPVEPETPATSGINYYESPGFISISSGQVTNTNSDWIHSDFIAIDSLTDDAELGHCIGKFTGHASVADIAFYSSNNFSSYITGKTSAGATKTLSALQSLMTELNATNATHIVISTDKTKNQLYACLK